MLPRLGVAGLLLAIGLPAVSAGEANVAVAANFTGPAEQIGAAFAAATGHDVVFSFGATGGLYAQITQGAPFDVFLAADARHPARAVAEGHGVAGTVFTYAVGKLVLYSPTLDVSDGAAVLRAGRFTHLAIADPTIAPYGAAAVAVIDRLGLGAALVSRQVLGGNFSQALQFVESGNAELGFVALSQVIGRPAVRVWPVPEAYYPAIRQDAVLLTAGADDAAARAFMAFLHGEAAAAIIRGHGYDVPR